jgi:hypothetical protein
MPNEQITLSQSSRMDSTNTGHEQLEKALPTCHHQPLEQSHHDMPPVDPFTPLLHFPTQRESPQRRRRLSTALLTAVLILVLWNCLATAREILSTYQVQLATVRYYFLKDLLRTQLTLPRPMKI